MKYVLLAITISALVAVTSPLSTVHADSSRVVHYTVPDNGTLVLPGATNGCGFDVTITQTGTANVTDFYDASGTLVSEIVATPQLEIDYSANGVTYTGISPAVVHFDFVTGTYSLTGLAEELHAAGGGVLALDATRVVWDLTTGAVLSRVGNTSLVGQDGLLTPAACAALAG